MAQEDAGDRERPVAPPILRLLAVDRVLGAVRPTCVVLTFARAGEDGCPVAPMADGRSRAWELDHAGHGELTVDEAGVVTVDCAQENRLQQWHEPDLPPHWTAGWPVRVEVRADGCLPAGSAWLRVPMRSEDAPHRIELPPAPVVAGRVVDETGAPVVGAELELVGRTTKGKRPCLGSCFGVLYRDDHDLVVRGTTDDAGGFALPYTVAGTVCVRVRADGWMPIVTAPFAVTLEDPPTSRELVLSAGDCGIEGVVRDFEGAPTARVPVVCNRADGLALHSTSDAGGGFRFPLPPGRYRVYRGDPTGPAWRRRDGEERRDPGRGPAVDPTQFAVEVRAGGFTTWDLEAAHPRDASLIVHIDAEWEDPANLPVRLWRVFRGWDAELAWPRRLDFYYLGDSPARFPELPPGRYRLLIGLDEREIDLHVGEVTEIRFELSTATVNGRLVDGDGVGIVARMELGDRKAESDADGAFQFHLVHPGVHPLRVFVERDGKEVLIYDGSLALPSRGRYEPVIRVDRTRHPD